MAEYLITLGLGLFLCVGIYREMVAAEIQRRNELRRLRYEPLQRELQEATSRLLVEDAGRRFLRKESRRHDISDWKARLDWLRIGRLMGLL